MAWGNSGLFGQTIVDIFQNTTALDYNSDTFKLALFNNSVTPAYDAAASSAAYNAGTWLVANEVQDGVWPAGGYTLVSPALTVGSPAAGQFKFSADSPTKGGTTLSSIYGCLIYDDTLTTPVADQAIMAIAFSGAPYSTTSGTLTLTVAANGFYYVDYTP